MPRGCTTTGPQWAKFLQDLKDIAEDAGELAINPTPGNAQDLHADLKELAEEAVGFHVISSGAYPSKPRKAAVKKRKKK